MPPLPEAIILALAPFAPLFSHRVWLRAQVLLLGAMLAPGPRTVTASLRVMGLALERQFTNYHRVLNRAQWSARQMRPLRPQRPQRLVSVDGSTPRTHHQSLHRREVKPRHNIIYLRGE
jgi:hypothetical protein